MTITREFTKEQLIAAACSRIDFAKQMLRENPLPLAKRKWEVELSISEIALASLEAEAVAWLLSGGGAKNDVRFDSSNAYADPLREVTPLYAAPQLPQPVVPNMAAVGEMPFLGTQENAFVSGWNACRAAMLQGKAEPVSNRDELATMTNQSEQVLDMVNSPVIQDGWVACCERMPEDDDFVHIWPRPDFGVELHVGQYCECHPKGDGWYAQVYEQNYGIEWHPITVTHWMPLPAAPQQESVSSALEHGMARYSGAMQKLADGGD